MRGLVFLISAITFVIVVGIQVTLGIQFNQDCGGYLNRAANANQVETAFQELDKAIEYLELNDLTSGYTSVLYKTPDEDIGFWYNNLVQARKELSLMPEDATPLERSNVLIKLRETLLHKEEVICPQGISKYPRNAFWGWITLISLIVTIGLLISYQEY